MADINETVVTTTQDTLSQQPTNEIPAEIRQQMEMSLNIGNPNYQPQVQTQAETVETKVENTGAVVETQPQVTDYFTPIKEKYGYESPEAALTELQRLKELETQFAQPQPLKFDNEQSEKVFNALKEGKFDEVYSVLQQQHKLDSLTRAEVTKDNADEIIKLGMQLEYSLLTPEEIDFQFRQKYALPKEPTQDLGEDDDDFAMRKAEWQQRADAVYMQKTIDAKMAKPKLEAAKQNLVLPEIGQSVDEGYVQYRQMLEQQAIESAQTKEAYKALTPDAIGVALDFTDEPNKIAFKFQYQPDSESFQKTVELLAEGTLFEQFKKSDGTYDRKEFLEAIHFGLHRKAILTEALKQAKNGVLKSQLPDNTQGGMQRQMPTIPTQPDYVREQMERAARV